MKEINLSKTGETATLELLTPLDLNLILKLQDETRDALPEAQKMFVLPRSAAYFQELLARETGLMIGIKQQEKLISHMAVLGAVSLSDVISQNLVTRNEIPFHHATLLDSVIIVKTMAVHPHWRGNSLAQQMLGVLTDLPLVQQADHVMAQVSAENSRSWDLFLRAGFGIVAAVIDPIDHKPRFVLQRPTLGFPQTPFVNRVEATQDFATIQLLTQRGLVFNELSD